jgi:hypothetical protein
MERNIGEGRHESKQGYATAPFVVKCRCRLHDLGINVGIIDRILTEDLSTINEGIPLGYIDQ